MIWSVVSTFLYCQAQVQALAYSQQQPTQLGFGNPRIRPAVETDLDDIATVHFDAFKPGPAWQYLRQHQDQYDEYRRRCLRKDIGDLWADRDSNDTWNVIAVPTTRQIGQVQHGASERVVAFASWQYMEPKASQDELQHYGKYRSLGQLCTAKCSDNLDINITRAIDFLTQMHAAETRYIEDYPGKQLYLGLLATHPDWDGHGFGAAHCHWGMDRAKAMGVPVTLLGTSAGWPLYDQLGFESLANITIRTLDWDTDIWCEYMKYEE